MRPYISKKPAPTVGEIPGYTTHKVQRGETVWAISKRYNLSPQTIIQINGIKDVRNIEVGQKLLIPRTDSSPRISPASVSNMSSKGFIWPLNGRILQRYGDITGGYKNTGIDIEARVGQSVVAAKGGVVEVVSANPSGWGKVIVIRHSDGLYTWYAHNSKVFVQKGNWVRRGQIISQAGQSGSVTRPELHFKIFRNDKPVDPLSYLPQR
ncbi:MAG: murein hydrolase activator EnvC family protein [Candidatus Brocadiales bacterium]